MTSDPGTRAPTKKRAIQLILAPQDLAQVSESVKRRNFPNRSEYLRWLIRQDAGGNLLYVDHAVEKLVDHLVSGFGSAVGYMAAEMERQQVELGKKRGIHLLRGRSS